MISTVTGEKSKISTREKGITLIALVVTIIVLLILAGVSIQMITGQNSILQMARKAKDDTNESERVEALNLLLSEYNINTSLTEIENFEGFLKDEKENGSIDDYFGLGQKVIIEYDKEYYLIGKLGGFYRVERNISTNLKGNEIGKSYIINADNANDVGSLEFQNGSSYIIIDEIDTKNFNFVIPSAEGKEENAVTIYLLSKMTIDNKGYERSAIELLDGAILNLYVYDEVTVNSGYGKDGEVGNAAGAKGGPGGYAGIHVPETATLNLYGEGTLVAYGGNAGNGTDSSWVYGGRRRWWSWSWYWWKWWSWWKWMFNTNRI